MKETVRLTVPGGELVGDLSQAAGEWGVLWIHGFGSHRGGEKAEAVAAACARRGWSFASFDFRGHGQSSGTMVELRGSGLLADLEAVRTELARRGVTSLGLIGSSMGGWAAAWFALCAGRAAAPACVFLAPAFHFLRARWDQLSEVEREQWQRTGRLAVQSEWLTAEIGYGLAEEREQFPIDRLTARWDRPLLIIHGMRDTVAPYSGSVAFVEQSAFSQIELRLLKDGDHRLTAFKDEIAEAACRFFERHSN
jgi:pimeloyl-ACP methyl ester carboxylesterase